MRKWKITAGQRIDNEVVEDDTGQSEQREFLKEDPEDE